MILVVGRPGLTEAGRLDRPAARVALAAAEAGARVELIGSLGDDPDGDVVTLELGRAGIGHAALLRDPAGITPRHGAVAERLPRLDAADADLGLRYISECRVLVLAEPLADDTLAVAADVASYHSAALVALVPLGGRSPSVLPATATVLEMPAEDDGAFSALVGRYAALLDAGRQHEDAWRDALAGSGWEESAAEWATESAPSGS